MKLEPFVVQTLAGPRKKAGPDTRFVTGTLKQTVFPALERPKEKMSLGGALPMGMGAPSLPPPVAAMEPQVSSQPRGDEFDAFVANSGRW